MAVVVAVAEKECRGCGGGRKKQGKERTKGVVLLYANFLSPVLEGLGEKWWVEGRGKVTYF